MNFTSDEKHRVFFSILPDKSALEKITVLQKNNYVDKARFLQPDQIHLTLLFLGSLDKNSLECIRQSAKNIEHQQMNLRFDQTGGFIKAGILWLGSEFADKNLIDLFQKLRSMASGCKIATEARPFKAHITLARKFFGKHFKHPDQPIHFQATHYHLVESISIQGGVKYRILESYTLT